MYSIVMLALALNNPLRFDDELVFFGNRVVSETESKLLSKQHHKKVAFSHCDIRENPSSSIRCDHLVIGNNKFMNQATLREFMLKFDDVKFLYVDQRDLGTNDLQLISSHFVGLETLVVDASRLSEQAILQVAKSKSLTSLTLTGYAHNISELISKLSSQSRLTMRWTPSSVPLEVINKRRRQPSLG